MPILLPGLYRPLHPFLLICLAWTLAAGAAMAVGAAMAADPDPDPDAGLLKAQQGEPATLTFWNREVAILRAEIDGISPAERVGRIQRKIESVLAVMPGDKADAIPGTYANLAGYWIRIDGVQAFGLVREDADAMTGETLDDQVRVTVAALQEALDARREQHSPSLILEGVGLTVVATLLLGVLLWGVARLHARAMRRQNLLAPTLIKANGLQLGPIFGHLERAAIKGTSFGLMAIAVYLWLTFILGRFPFSRPWGEKLAWFLLDMLANFAKGALLALPGLFTVLVIFVLTRIIVRAVDGFYQTVERGAMSVTWLQADTAKATRRLTVVLIWIFAVTVAYPYIPGSDSEAFKGISVFVGLMVSLGSAGLVNQVMSGLVVAYSRALKAGEFVQLGNTLGVVSEVNMLSTKVITPKRETITVPNAVLVSSPITNFSRLADERGAIVGTKVTIGYDTPWRQVHAMLTLAAQRASLVRQEPEPFVMQRALADFYPEYELIVHIDHPEQRAMALSELHAHIQDVFNEYGVQIMSPNFVTQPEQKVWVAKGDWYAAPAAPGDRIVSGDA